jgi:hypothetical protein
VCDLADLSLAMYARIARIELQLGERTVAHLDSTPGAVNRV